MTTQIALTDDAERVLKIAQETFVEAYQDRNAESDIRHYLNTVINQKEIEIELADKNIVIFLVSQEHDDIAYAKLRTNADGVIEIARFYVRREYYGQGIAQQLMAHCIKHAESVQSPLLRLYVWEENHRAIRFYEKCKFITVGKTTFDWGTGKIDDDFVMEFPIR